MKVFAAVAALFVTSNAFSIPKMPSFPSDVMPMLVGGKFMFLPKIVAVKSAIGLAGLKIAGAQYLKKKVLVPASIAGAQAGYKATSSVLAAPQLISASKTAAVHGLFDKVPSMPQIEVQEAPVAPIGDFQHTFKVPVIPQPAIEWYDKSVNLKLPKMVLRQPPVMHKTISLVQAVPVQMPPTYNVPEEMPEVSYGAAPTAS